jgi:hypothetical protein
MASQRCHLKLREPLLHFDKNSLYNQEFIRAFLTGGVDKGGGGEDWER